MARLFRLLEKKRGQRRTGSNLLGSVGEALFCGSLFLLGVLSLSATLASQLRHPDPTSFALGVGGWLIVLVMSAFVIVGGGGLIWTVLRVGTSAERRSAMARRASEIDLTNDVAPRPKNYPTVPSYAGLINSPGIDLAYRLPPSKSPGWRLLASAIFALLWNGVACVLLVWAIRSHLADRPEWFLSVFMVPFLAVSVWSIRYLFQSIWIHTGMGLTTLEISDHPLVPGHEYQVALSQHGHIAVNSLELWLVCEEEATYRQGTDIRTEVRRVMEKQLFQRKNFRIEPVEPFQALINLPIPATAMHSFQSPHNSVQWRLVVRGHVANWPQFERGFSIVVFPGEATLRVEVGSVARNALRELPAAVSRSAAPVGASA